MKQLVQILWWKCKKISYSLISAFCVRFIFLSSKEIGFLSGALQKMPPLPSFMEEFGQYLKLNGYKISKN